MATNENQLDSCLSRALSMEPTIYRDLASERRAAAQMEKIRNFDCKCHSKENSDQQQQPAVTSASCSQKLDPAVILESRRKTAALSRHTRDLLLLGIIKTCMADSEMTLCTKRVNSKRPFKFKMSTYMVNSVVVCRATFCFVYGISNKDLNALKKHYVENGLKPRMRKRKLHRSSSSEDGKHGDQKHTE